MDGLKGCRKQQSQSSRICAKWVGFRGDLGSNPTIPVPSLSEPGVLTYEMGTITTLLEFSEYGMM